MLQQCKQWAFKADQPLPQDMADCIRLVGANFERSLLGAEYQRRVQELKEALQPLVSCLLSRVSCP